MEKKELEALVKSLQKQVSELQGQTRTLQDIEDIKKLQSIYAYYLEHGMFDEIIALFSDDFESIDTGFGLYRGKEGVVKHFSPGETPSDWLHITMPLSSVIDVAPDGKSAKGRWYALLCVTLRIASIPRALFGAGTYENEYVKEAGKWKFRKLHFCYSFQSPFEEGWVKTPFAQIDLQFQLPKPDQPSVFYQRQYPSGYVLPFHYKHPITGK